MCGSNLGAFVATCWGGTSAPTPPHSGQPIVYQTSFISSFNTEIPIFVTPTDILIDTSGAWQFITPTYTSGTVTVNNGSPTVTGDGYCRWATDIAENAQFTVKTTVAAGATAIQVEPGGPSGVYGGVVIQDLNALDAIPPGTYYASFGANNYFNLSQPTIAAVTAGDIIQLGAGLSLRPIVRAGDQISFGSNEQNSPSATWYTVQSVTNNGSLTLTAPYVGSNATTVPYTIRQLLTDTTKNVVPSLPECSSTKNFPAAGGYAPGDQWYFTNGIDPLIVWNPTFQQNTTVTGGAFFVRTSPNQTVNAVEQKQGVLILGGLTQNGTLYGTSIASSDNGFPMQFAGGVSFQGIASDGPFIITRLAILGSTLMIYQSGKWGGGPDNSDDMSGAVTTASFVGYPTIWAFSDVIKTRGAADRRRSCGVPGSAPVPCNRRRVPLQRSVHPGHERPGLAKRAQRVRRHTATSLLHDHCPHNGRPDLGASADHRPRGPTLREHGIRRALYGTGEFLPVQADDPAGLPVHRCRRRECTACRYLGKLGRQPVEPH